MSRTSSIRLNEDLYERLERFARRRGRGKSAVIVSAVEDYLNRHELRTLAAEARRQSVAASGQPEDDSWYEQADDTGWK
jgi:predicted DNA-binding protein